MKGMHLHANQPYYTNLSFEQKLLFNAAVIRRKSLFFSGSAGTGKSHLLRAIIKGLSRLEDDEKVVVTAPTGTAAVNISGCTIQSFAGFLDENLSEQKFPDMLARTRRVKQARKRWIDADVLIIDECSMLQGTYFDCLEYVARNLRGGSSKSFFGGIQLILCGDFLQLPPVVRSNNPLVWLFEAKAFQLIPLKASLTHCFRQSDKSFISMLNETRIGCVSPQTDSLLQSLLIHESELNNEHDRISEKAYRDYSAEIKTLEEEGRKTEEARQFALEKLDDAADELSFRQSLLNLIHINRRRCELEVKRIRTTYVSPSFPVRLYTHRQAVDEYNNSNLLKGKQVIFRLRAVDENLTDNQHLLDPPPVISISIGAQVIITKNIDVQRGLCNGRQCVVKDIFYFQSKVGSRAKRSAASDLYRSEANGGLSTGPNEITLIVGTQMVVVEVQVGDRVQQIHPFTYEIKKGNDNVIGKRTQIPLGLAYALSIHKCQGMTLDTAIINIEKAFSPGQAYVALSRLRTIDGIRLTGYARGRIRADKKAMDFHETLLHINMSNPAALRENGLWSFGTELCQWKVDHKSFIHRRGYDLAPQYSGVTSLAEVFSTLKDNFTCQFSSSLQAPTPQSSATLDPPFILKKSTNDRSKSTTQSASLLIEYASVKTFTSPTHSNTVGVVDLASSQEDDPGPKPDCGRKKSDSAPKEPERKQLFTVEMFLPHLRQLVEAEKNQQLKMKPQTTDLFLQRQKQTFAAITAQAKDTRNYFSNATPFKPADSVFLE